MNKNKIISILNCAITNSDYIKEKKGLIEARKIIKDLPNSFCNRNPNKKRWIKNSLGYVCPKCKSSQIYKSNFCSKCGEDLR